MASVTFPPGLGGDGSTVSDDANPSTGLANGGHRTRFVPALAQLVAVSNGTITQANTAVSNATTQASNALTSANNAAASAASAVNSPGTTATSTTSLAIGTGSKSLTLAQTGKAFAVGQYVQIVNTADTTQWMLGAITAFTAGTGAMTVNVVLTNGAGTLASWAISLGTPPTPALVPTPVPTIVLLTSGTSWTVPGGITRVKATIVGGGGSGAKVTASAGVPGPGGSGSVVVRVFTGLTPGGSISYSIGAGGVSQTTNASNGNTGGSTTFNSVTAAGGGAGSTGGSTIANAASGTGDVVINGGAGARSTSADDLSIGGDTPLGLGLGGVCKSSALFSATGYGSGGGGTNDPNNSQAGQPGCVILEY